MPATSGELPAAGEDEWAYEMKWDGVRAIGYLERGGLRLVSRNDLDITPAYPEVLGLVDAVDDDVLHSGATSTPDLPLTEGRELLDESAYLDEPPVSVSPRAS